MASHLKSNQTGRNWHGATNLASVVPIKNFIVLEFQSLFETMITKVYANRLGSYEDQKIVVLGSEKKKKDYQFSLPRRMS